MRLNKLVSYPDLYSLSTTTHKLCTAPATELTIYIAASSLQHNWNLQVSNIIGSRGVCPHPTNPLVMGLHTAKYLGDNSSNCFIQLLFAQPGCLSYFFLPAKSFNRSYTESFQSWVGLLQVLAYLGTCPTFLLHLLPNKVFQTVPLSMLDAVDPLAYMRYLIWNELFTFVVTSCMHTEVAFSTSENLFFPILQFFTSFTRSLPSVFHMWYPSKAF